MSSDADQILVRFGDDRGVGTPATAAPCASCHGPDGRGRPEGGAEPSDIRWPVLARPSTPTASKVRPAYSEELVLRAFTRGVDSAGNVLSPVMPRYQMSAENAGSLIAYLKTLGGKPDPGVTGTTVRIGVLLPPSQISTGLGQAIRAVIAAWFEQTNRQGGIYGRRIETRFQELPVEPSRRPEVIRAFVKEQEVFALVASFLAGTDEGVPSLWQDLQVPVVGALSHALHTADATNRYVFYLDGGLDGQVKALMDFAIKSWRATKPDFAVIYSPDNQARATAVVGGLREIGWTIAGSFPAGNALSAKPTSVPLQVVLVLGLVSPDKLEALETSGYDQLVLLVPGSFLSPEFLKPGSVAGARLFTAFPMLPSDVTSEGLFQYKRMAEIYHLSSNSLPVQFSAMTSAKLFTEMLARAGRDLSRERLIEIMQNTQGLQTGFSPPLTFGLNRREGLQSHVLEIDRKTK